jgi:hypothetical protein
LPAGLLSLLTYGITGGDPTDDSFIKVAGVAGEGSAYSYRVYWSSSIFMLGGLYFHVVNAISRRGFWWWVILAALAFALWVTQIRAFLGAAFIFLVLPPVLRRVERPMLSGNTPAGVLFIWAMSILSVSVAMNPELLQIAGLSRDVSDVVRVDQAEALLSQFAACSISAARDRLRLVFHGARPIE